MTSDEVLKRRQLDSTSTDRLGDPIGRSGLELKYEAHLRGIRGMRRVVKNRRGETIATEELKAPQHGRDLVLTLDVEVQRRSEELLDQALNVVTPPEAVDEESNRDPSAQPNCPQGGCIVAIDVNSGAILAAASAPRYDLNLLVKPNREQWDDLMQDPRKPLFSRATHMALAPGSTFKVITAAAALESGKINPNVPIPCHGYLDRPDQHRCLIYRHHKLGHGDILLPDALCRSCNVYFFTAARRMGPQVLSDWAGRFGIGQSTGVDLPSEGTGHLPSPDEIVRGNRRRWHPADTLGLAIGQADLLVTPLQMARVMAAIANGGQLVTPHFAGEAGPVAMSDAPSFRAIFPHPDPQQIPDLHPATLAQIRNGLDMVVNHPAGTAFKSVHMKEVNIAGKTGTAESGGSDHAWFAGYVPAEQPRVAFVVVLEHGGSGGKAAGPVAKNFVKCLLDLGLLTPSTDLARDSDR
jgi:penicillin-binding protein 2